MVTRKEVTVTIICTFEGDYIPADQITAYLDHWLYSGLDDRDDLVGISISYSPIHEENIHEPQTLEEVVGL